jgi:hypothetical protein
MPRKPPAKGKLAARVGDQCVGPTLNFWSTGQIRDELIDPMVRSNVIIDAWPSHIGN